MRVYCKNCMYYDEQPHKIAKRFNYSPLKILHIMYGDCNMGNQDNNCNKYKRKWYKFWIKDGE